MFRITHRNGGFDHHESLGIHFQDLIDHGLYRRGVEEISFGIVVGRCGDNHEIRIPVGGFSIRRRLQLQLFFCKKTLDLRVLNRRFPRIDHLHLLFDQIHRLHLMVLR